MGILSAGIGAAKWVKNKTLETGRTVLLDTPVKVAKWARKTIGKTLYTGLQRDITGPLEDKTVTRPGMQSLDRTVGAGPIEKAEGRRFADTRNKVRVWARDNAHHANRIGVSADEMVIRSEKNVIDSYSGDVEREINIVAPAPSVLERMAVRRLNELVNMSRPAGNQLTLLSSPHPISEINQQRSFLYSQKGIPDHPSPLNLLRYPPSEREKIEKTGNVSYTKIGKRPRFDASGEERRRALDAPIISDDGLTYSSKLAEKHEDYATRARILESNRMSLESFPLSVQVSLGDPEYPVGGNPFKLYEKLYSKYENELKNTHWNQLSLSMVRRGKTVTLTGFLTKGRPIVPETMHEPPLPRNFNDDWWYAKAEQAIDMNTPIADYRREANLLSYYCQNPSKLATDTHELKAEDFKEERHQVIFTALQAMQTAGTAITPRSLTNHILGMGKIAVVGGRAYVNHVFLQALIAGYSPKIGVGVLKKRATARSLYEGKFHSGVSVLAFTNLDLLVKKYNEGEKNNDIEISDKPQIMVDTNSLLITLNIGGQQPEELNLIKGTDLFQLQEKSIFKESAEGEGNDEQSIINIEELLQKIKYLKKNKIIKTRPIPIS